MSIVQKSSGHNKLTLELERLSAKNIPFHTAATMVSAGNNRGDGLDDIRYVTLRNVRGYCAGGHHIVRFLNASGLKIHDVIFDGLIDTSGSGKRCRAALKIGDNNPKWGGVTPLGDTYRIFVGNIM
ncbi:MAG: hypothetical protein NT154_46700, partial [Verrucomicrobia bacterium]|nr:hypothetical protein [Verrucomicrobiota bacterium]